MKKLFLIVTLAVAILALSACGSPLQSDLASNLTKWQNQKLSHYSYDLTIGCFCAFSRFMPLHVEVKGGQVAAITANDGSPLPADMLDTFKERETVDQLFTIIQNAIDQHPAEMTVTYDATYGFPAAIAIDQSKQIADEEISYSIANFVVLP